MKCTEAFRRLIVCGLLLGLLGATGRLAGATEQPRAFLDGLRQQGLVDEALAYLEQSRTSPLVPNEFKEVIDREAGEILLAGAAISRDAAVREKRLAAAQQRFRKFLREHPNHALAGQAEMQCGLVLVEIGRLQVRRVRRPSIGAKEKSRLMAEARARYLEAREFFAAAEKRFVEQYRKFPKLLHPRRSG